jgi:CubicO group peptidase (beta-lactamase class C family)
MSRPLLALLAAATLGNAPLLGQRPPAPDSVDRLVIAEMRRQHVPGLALAVISHGRIVKARGYGFANVELRVPATDTTIFQSGSVGKQFTAAGVLLLVEDGKLGLDDPITKYLPEGDTVWRGITVRHLLTHTSGIHEYVEDADSSLVDVRHDYTEDELVRVATRHALDFAPGTRWSYSNTGYMLLGAIIHRVSGKFYGDFLAERIFRPLGMRTARVISEADIVHNRADGYRLVDGQLKNQEWVAPSLNTTADGALYLTVRDLAAWDRGLTEGRGLSPKSRAAMWTPARLAGDGSVDYGFGWGLAPYRGRRAIGHTGSWQGFKAMIQRFPDDSLSVILLANLAETRQRPFVYAVAGVYRRGLLPPHTLAPSPDTALGARLLAALGRLALPPDSGGTAFVRGYRETLLPDDARQLAGLLSGQVPGQPATTFRGCDDLGRMELERHGARVARSCYLSVADKDGPTLVTFWVTPKGEVADISTYGY